MSNAVFILGMHRSGTSATAAVCAMLGVHLGDDLLPAHIDNQKGYYEDRGIVSLHDALLATEGLSWDSLCAPVKNWDSEEAAPLLEALAGRAAKLSAEHEWWGFKDPRSARLLDVWQKILPADVTRYAVIPLRHPLEIAASLRKRNGFSTEESCWLWFQHLVEIERGTRTWQRAWVQFPTLLDSPDLAIADIQGQLGVAFPRAYVDAKADVLAFLEKEMRHHIESEENFLKHPDVPGLVKDLYTALKKPDDVARKAQLDEIYRVFRRDYAVWELKLRETSRRLLVAERSEKNLNEELVHIQTMLSLREKDLREHMSELEHVQQDAKKIAVQRDELYAAKRAIETEAAILISQRDELFVIKDKLSAEATLLVTQRDEAYDKIHQMDELSLRMKAELAHLRDLNALHLRELEQIKSSKTWRYTRWLRRG